VNPFYFGDGARRLFGVYTPAGAARASARAVVLCHPWGQEYTAAHRSMRALSSMLSAAGMHVLRFDYFGTGDSSGDMRQADLDGWQADIGMAIEELKDTAGVAKVGLAGLRLGATLGARAAAKRRDVDALALWEPIVSGESHIRELIESGADDGKPTPADPGDACEREVGGFPMTPAMARELRALDFAAGERIEARTLAVVSSETGSCDALRAAMSPRFHGTLQVEQIVATPAWIESVSFSTGAVPIKVLQRIVEWFK
jgi:pimeloyl-ACP methyl ester carboxylesterase